MTTHRAALICAVASLMWAPSLPAEESGEGATAESASARPSLPDPAAAQGQAPEQFRVRLDTTEGPIVIEVTRSWAPHGADRFYNLARIGFFEDVAFFRVIPNFMAQFGIHGDPEVSKRWRTATIQDDPVVQSNERGFVTYAKTRQPDSRTTQLFINLKHNKGLDAQGFAPFGRVVEGMEVVDAIYKVGEGRPRGRGPAQQRIQRQGNAYLKESFPQLDYVERAAILD